MGSADRPESPFPAEAWANGRRLAEPRLSPDATVVTFIADGELALIQLENGIVTWLPLFPKIAKSYDWLPDGSGLVYAGKDNCIHRFEIETHSCHPVTTTAQDISAVAVSPDGIDVAYVDDMHDLFVVDMESGESTRLSSDADFVFDPAWSIGSQHVAWHEWDVPNMAWDGSRIVVRRSDASDAIRTVAGGDNIAVQQPRFSPDGKYLSFLSDETGWLNLWTMNATTFDNAKPLIEEAYEHGDATWSPGQRSYAWTNDGEGVLYARNEAGFGRMVHYDVTVEAKWPSESRDHYTSFDAARERAVAIRAGFNRSPEVELISAMSNSTLARSSYVGLEDAGVEPEPVEWKSEDGTRIFGRLYRAIGSNGQPAPLLLWIHGGPTDQSQATMYGRWSYFLQRGWSVLVPDYRGTTGWGREFTQSLRGRWGEVDVADTLAGAKVAIERGWAPADAIVPFGGSAGGLTALLLMEKYPELWAAGVVMYPVADLLALAQDSWRFEAHYSDTLVGPLPEFEETYRERSPLTHIAAIAAPLLVMHGDSDIVVPVDQSQSIAKELEAAGKTVEFHVYEAESHGWRKPETRIDELQRVESFLNRYVLHQERESS